ncbi:amino acid adenylation domain-containing protein [Tumebacillus sp. BK434]|uniref:non-ribosomal peptide synthetase/type I polyketide synthase n=1 Tax=Tumebacillus sp. BK434 TaxID=2512169 RepID=UPI0010516988|nr:non-ribosomal peptide synthetase/type I polyketide synthase [Tumebacillus sp. BK434]TCP54572.1 amino acid adenylation domain-containing protein [Tumebacillus sp. BK434]
MADFYVFPVSFSQQRLWFLDQLMPGSPAYNLAAALRMEGVLNREALERTLKEIVNRHESLRTVFGLEDGQPVQKIFADCEQELPMIDLQQLPDAVRRTEAERLTAEEALRPFDLETGPLLRTTLLQVDEQEHVLLITMHHIISDGWSIGILVSELKALYTAFANGEASPLPELEFQYAEFSDWQQEALQGDFLDEDLGYWRDKLAGNLPVLQLPTDRPRPSQPTDKGGALKVRLSKELTERLKESGRTERATLFMTLLAAYQVFLHRYTGQEDILVGSPTAGRYLAEVEGLIGFFVNNLVMRGDLSGAPTFGEFLAQVRQTALDAFTHEKVPFEMLVKELQPERNMSTTPLFQTMFTLNAPLASLELPGLQVTRLELESPGVKFDLLLEMVEEAEGLVCIWEYKSELFDAETIARMAANFTVLLEGIAADPSQKIADLPLMTEAERLQVVETWNATARDYPQHALLHELFEQQAERTPDAVALVFEGETLTYRELNERANALASRLVQLGVQPDTFVGVCMERSLELVVSLYGVLKAGAAYVPVDPTLPAERVAYLLEDSQVNVVLTQQKVAGELPVVKGALLIAVDAEDWSQDSTANPGVPITADHLAYMIYTSGSTGKPKGAMIPHRGVVNRLLWMQDEYGLTADDTVLQKTPMSFDVSVWEFFWPLLFGARMVVARPEGHKDSAYLRDLIKAQGITTLHFVPSMFQIFVEESGLEACTSLRRIFCSGEALPFDLQQRSFSRLPHVELHNLYGPTEASIDVSYWACEQDTTRLTVPIGRPVANTQLYVLDAGLRLVPIGVAGELHIGGVQLARGYHNRQELTAEKFIDNPFGDGKLYKTGDLVRFLADGVIEYLGRLDHQVKIRGFRIELGEIEALLALQENVREAVVMAKGDTLAAFVVAEAGVTAQDLRRSLQEQLPAYMVPNTFTFLPEIPTTPNGKADRKALLDLVLAEKRPEQEYVQPQSDLEQKIATIWQDVLGVERVGLYDNFFDLGGHSLLIMQVHRRLQEEHAFEITVVQMFQYPTVSMLADYLSQQTKADDSAKPDRAELRKAARSTGRNDIAVIGLAGRFPGANDVQEFWENLRDGVESITHFTEEELIAEGHDPQMLQAPNYVKAAAVLENIEWFDADFFGINPREAEIMDPQHRIFLETAWQALESAGYDSEAYDGSISVYAGTGLSHYLLFNLLPNQEVLASVGQMPVLIGNGTDHLAARVAYKLNLKGASLGVSTACSTALVSIHMACQSLLNGECDMAMAGGVSVAVPQKNGYFHVEGGISSPDGHCRAFDADAQGTVPGSGTGVVVLKRLDDALRDGDHIMAVVKGSAVNNDGSQKVGYTAPSVEGQAAVISEALAIADVHPESVSYIEAHGTATPLGDPIEMTALTQAYRKHTEATNYCAVGSVKSNIGHLDAGAGAAGFIKTVLSLYNEEMPPSLHFKRPNPKVDWERSPFFVNTQLRDWSRGEEPRRAAVSSFGLGGNNAHAVLEEAPLQVSGPTARAAQLLLLSAKTEGALEAATANLKAHLQKHPEQNFADVIYTLQAGRRSFEHRRAIVVSGREDAMEVLDTLPPRRLLNGYRHPMAPARPVAFLFAGTGDHYVNMASELYKTEPTFKQHVDRCSELLMPHLGLDLRDILYPEAISAERDSDSDQPTSVSAPAFDLRKMLRRDGESNPHADKLNRTEYAHPALFVIEYALTQLLQEWGIRPQALIGYSLGEYVAACVAGVFSLEDALALVAKRAKLIQALPNGSMLAVPMSPADLEPLLGDTLSLATINTPNHCVVSGPTEAVAALEQQLLGRQIACLRVQSSHAFHSQMLAPIAGEFAALVQSFQPQAPHTPFVSNVTGTWITAEEATDPFYWARHMCQTVRFADGVTALCEDPNLLLLEIGPGQTLTSFALQQLADRIVLPTLRPSYEKRSDLQFLLGTLGQLWLTGVPLDWQGLYTHEQRLRVPLPTYPFERKRYWIDAKPQRAAAAAAQHALQQTGETAAPQAQASQAVHARPQLATAYVEATNDFERAIIAIYQQLLGIEGVGIHDSFFQLGGNSLLGTQLVSRLRSVFGIDVPLRTLFEAETAAELAAAVQAKGGVVSGTASAVPAAPQIPRRPEGAVPLTFAQERIWVMEQLEPGGAAYNIPLAVEMHGQLDLTILTRCINEVIARHETLRTTFKAAGGQPVVEFSAELKIEVGLEDLTGVGVAERSAAENSCAFDLARQPFDLSNGPLLRATAIRTAADRHVLVLIIHHIIADGWSLGVLIREIAALYEAFSQGQPSPLAELAIQYSDFAHWQKTPEQQAALDEHLVYWKEQLSGSIEPLALPTDRPRPANQTFTGATESFTISGEVTSALQTLSAQEGATLFMTLLAAYKALLARYTGQTDILIGSPVAGRSRREVEDLIGVFINTLVLRSQAEADTTFRAFLQNVRQTTLDAMAHSELPFEKLVEELQPERNTAYSPLFQAMFNMLNQPLTLTMPGLTLDSKELNAGTAKFDITLTMRETDSGLYGEWEYNTDLFEAATINRMIEHFQTLLAAIAAHPEQTLATLPLLSAAEQQIMLLDWNNTGAAADEAVCIHRLFEQQVERTPDATALVFEGRELTFRDLNNRANHVARELQALGVGPDDLVGIYMERSPEMMTALLAVHKAGGGYLPLDPSYPQDRLAFMIEDAAPKVLLTQAALAGQLPPHAAQVLQVTAKTPEGELPNPASAAEPEHLAYIIYTSGSTGKPKGVMVEHRHAYRFFLGMDGAVGCGAGDAMLAVTSIGFDISVLELFWTLTRGAKVVLMTEQEVIEAGVSFSDYSLKKQLVRHRATMLQCTPSLMGMITATPEGISALHGLHKILLGGEAMPLALARLLKTETDARLFNMYGPTEATVWATVYEVTAPEALTTIPLGRPITGYTLYILNEQLQPAPVGVGGELHIGGAGVTRGYLGRPELTAERFIPNPYGDGLLYKTGDLAAYLPDGSVKFLGRLDHQVKVRGYRIELGEIETRLAEHATIREAVVIARDNNLIAYVVTEDGLEPQSADLRALLRETLPDYMVPSAFVHLEAMPLTPNGKVDRKALPAVDGVGLSAEQAYVPPSTPLEFALTTIWSEVLRADKIGVQDDFFAHGGHSLLATQLVSRIISDLGLTITLRDVFNNPTLRDMARLLQNRTEGTTAELAPVLPGSRERERDASYSQQRLWFLEQLEPDNVAHNVPEILRIQGKLDLEIVERSLQAMFRRHDSLRTNFIDRDGQAMQVVEPADTFKFALNVIDLTHLPYEARDAEAQRIAEEVTNTPFDLSQDLLLHLKLVKISDEEYVAAPVFHHIITDAWSMGVFFTEMQAHFEAFTAGQEPDLPEPVLQFSDYAVWHRDWLEGESLQAQLAFWQERLKGDLPVLQLPSDRPRPQERTHEGSHHSLHLSVELTQKLHQLCKQEGTTMYMTLLTAYKTLLHLYSGQTDILVGSPIANRQKKELEGLIGFFVNTLVMRTELSPELTFRELLQRVRNLALDAYANQDVPFEKLVEKLAPKRSLSHSPIFQTMFTLQNPHRGGAQSLQMPGMSAEAAGLKLTRLGVEKKAAQFDIQLLMADGADGLRAEFEYATDLFDEATIARMAEHFERLLQHIVDAPDAKLTHLHPFTDGEAERLFAKRSIHLPQAEQRQPAAKPAFLAPRTPLEAELADIFKAVFSFEKIGVHDDFFELGGHSLLATRAVARINQQFDVRLPLRALFEAPTIAELAALIEAGGSASQAPELTPILPVPRDSHLPLSFAQERLWFLDQLQPGTALYNIPVALRLQGTLDEDALLQSFQAVIHRHESLRTTFHNAAGQPKQVIAETLPLSMPVLSVANEAEARLLAKAEAEQPFDLLHGPLLRVKLLRITEDDHLLVVTMHHIITDEWSMGILIDEMAACYRDYAAGNTPFPMELPVQYADYAAWQRERLQGEYMQQELGYWKQQLGGQRAVLQLPTDYPRPAVLTNEGASISFSLSEELTEQLNLLSRQEGATLYMTLLSAFNTLLYRYTGQEDIFVGSPISVRGREEVEPLIGFFVNTLVLRTDLSGMPSFRSLLARVRQTALDAYAHQEVPFEKLVEELQPERSMNVSPLFQVLFTLQNTPRGTLEAQGLRLTPEPLDSQTAKFELSLTMIETADGLTAMLEYNTDLFAADTIERMAGHFETLLQDIAARPDATLVDLQLLTVAEEQQLLHEWTEIQAPPSELKCFHQLFAEQAARTPDAEAVITATERLTYRELDERANRLAHYLQKQGVAPESLVALCLERTTWMITAVLAVLKAGGAYVPIDPTYPPDRIATMLGVCTPPLLLTDQDTVWETEARVLQLADLTAALEAEPAHCPPSSVQPHNLAYIIFTSGTTGVPKGVMIQHDTLHTVSESWSGQYGMDAYSPRSLQVSSMSFDVFVCDMILSLLTGGALVICPNETRLDLDGLYRLMQEEKVELLNATPGLVVPLLEHIWQHHLPLGDLKLVLVGSDAFAAADYVTLLERFGDRVRIANCYGITETTIDSSNFEATHGEYDPRWSGIVPIGRPIGNTRMYVLDRNGKPQPIGIAGELYIGGSGVGRGYYNRPDATEERFVPSPFVPGERLYRTGDMARWLPGRIVQYLGRLDHQVKLRGFRIELSEIEAVLNEHPSVARSVVSVWENDLAAYYIGDEVPVAELRNALKERLPIHMVPSFYMRLDELPFSPNGKVDRKALPMPERGQREAEYVAPSTPTEEHLMQIWSELLMLDKISVHDNFFHIGGHSLLATQLVSRVQTEFEVQLHLRDLFEKTTIAELAQAVDAAEKIVAEEMIIKRRERTRRK